jgi:acetyltransferase-like isoleucine patch superfamily enzyme
VLSSLRWIVRNRAFTPHYLVRYWRFAWLKVTKPHIATDGFVFLGKGVRLHARTGYGRLRLGRWVHIGNGSALRAHEGTLRIGDKVVIGEHTTMNCYLDIEVGATTIIADLVHVTDFDHAYAELDRPIKDQGIVKSPVRIGPDCWLGVKSTILRGVTVGAGSVIAANAVVTRDVPPGSVVAGVPGKIVKNRAPKPPLSR